jgi:hypothetical protein
MARIGAQRLAGGIFGYRYRWVRFTKFSSGDRLLLHEDYPIPTKAVTTPDHYATASVVRLAVNLSLLINLYVHIKLASLVNAVNGEHRVATTKAP